MKVKSLFLSLLVMAGLAACSDDVTDNGGNEVNVTDASPAYLRISFSANGSGSTRSTADDANNTGDTHGDQEDSGHHNAGTDAENNINTVLIVAVPAEDGNAGFVKVYTGTGTDANLTEKSESSEGSTEGGTDGSTEGTGTASQDVLTITDANSKTYVNQEAIKLSTGKYNVLVVVNPITELINGVPEGSTTDVSVAKELYDKIVTGQYSYNGTDADTYVNAANSLGSGNTVVVGEKNRAGFMMANKGLGDNTSSYTVELTSANSQDNPAMATIEVERVLSKITYRAANTNNVYTVAVREPGTLITTSGWIEKTTEDNTQQQGQKSTSTYVYVTFNECRDASGNTVYGYWEDDATNGGTVFKGAYRKTNREYTETIESEEVTAPIYVLLTPCTEEAYDSQSDADKENYYVVDNTQSPEASLKVQSSDNGETTNYYIKLEGYALINLSKKVNYVRHTTDAAGLSQPFGTLNGTNFLWTPYWADKNNVQFDADGNFANSPTVGTWFYNTLADVAEESEGLTVDGTDGSYKVNNVTAQYFKAFDSSAVSEGNLMTGTNHTSSSDPDEVGALLGYCFENSTDIDHQTHGLSTGISFLGRIYTNKECTTALTALYLYNGNTFGSLKAISNAYGASYFSQTWGDDASNLKSMATLVEKNDSEVTAEDLKGNPYGIVKYSGNVCYYYTSEIKHFDNGDPNKLGNMEYAIMRNNIYSLSVTDINRIGDPYIDPTPGVLNESTEAALTLKVNILPWIVRYNDIEF